ncbi:MAG: OmpA family protein [Candidatus Adiutrix sp.]|nr:OmpA family protein [Candidatus Adiutrix sp.]
MLASLPALAEVAVQVMSVQDEAAAKMEVSRLVDLGVPAFTRPEQIPERGVWNRVYVGPFDTEKDAQAAAETLKKQGAIKDFLVKGGAAPAAVPASQAVVPEGETPGNETSVIEDPGNETPVLIEAAQPEIPSTPPLPVAETPTYGEPVQPEQARELELPANNQPEQANQAPAVPPITTTYGQAGAGAASQGGLPTYGQAESAPPAPLAQPAPARGLPPGLAPGDNLPGLVLVGPEGNAPRPPADNSTSQLPPLPPAAAPVTAGPQSSAGLLLAPSAGDYGGQNLSGFTMLVDLSSSMRRMTNCQGRIKEEAVASLLRKMNHRIPNYPYTAALRVFGYKMAVTRLDFTTLYYGPATFNRNDFEDAIGRLSAADSISPFATAINSADEELQNMGSPKAALMFSDFEESIGSGNPVKSAGDTRRRFDGQVAVHTFYITRLNEAEKLAKNIAQAGGGQAYDICQMISDDVAFENMMMEIFGPGNSSPCADQDGDGVCDDDDRCPDTPRGAPVDERGCWIAAYSQFFDFNKDVVKSAFLPRIQHAADIINKNPGLPTVIIAGHTDNVGSADYNMGLGRRRAQAVSDLLVKYGVSPSRLQVESFGASRPVATNDTEEGRARNRRVEFHIGQVAR